ncbi:MAG: pyridoxal phosphate-dependent aminotransferase family protein [Clostridiaceae bacterium]|nr:pyridoxal phosphate-dependent aminotransferase family protein [Clostridiaceae bacterium]
MYLQEFYNRCKVDKSLAEKTGFNPYYNLIQSGLNDPLIIEGREFISLASNNYLGLAADERVRNACIKAIEKYGASLCGTPIATGYTDLYKTLEDKLSSFLGLEDTIILPSCYQANNGLFSAIAGKEDLIVADHFVHSSLLEGIKAAGCKIRPFLHNNIEHLEQVMQNSSKYRQVFIVTESVFSTEGSIAPFKEIVEIARRYNAVSVVDDSHGVGVIGSSGRGVLEECHISGFDGIYTASLGKALANSGGIISGKKEIIDYLRYYCSHLVYSTAIVPSVLAGVLEVLAIIEQDFEKISNRMWNYKELISSALLSSGFEVIGGKAPITSIACGDAESTLALAKAFYDSSIITTPFIEPSVPRNQGRVRLIAGANLKEESVEKAAKIIKSLKANK